MTKHSKGFIVTLVTTLFLSSIATAESASERIAIIKKGEYLATAGNCAGCHTVQGRELYAGGVSFRTNFGTIYSTNITSDPETGIGQWEEADFKNALREGIRPNGQHLYPVFPYASYTGLSDSDVSALYAYFKTVPPATSSIPDNDLMFPFNQRWLMWAWKALYFDAERHIPDGDQPPAWNRGAYLVEVLGHCSACHTPRNLLGAEDKERYLSGGAYIDRVPNGQFRRWSAVDLTPSSVGLGPWSIDEITAYLKTGLNSYATSFGSMNKVIMGSTRYLTDADLNAMAVYLKSLPATTPPDDSEVDQEVFGRGERIYSIHCATCHLPTGKGDVETGPAMVGNPVVQATDPASLINVILYGPELPEVPLPVQRTRMDPYEHQLSDQEVADVSSYMRSAWGNSGGRVTVKQARKQR